MDLDFSFTVMEFDWLKVSLSSPSLTLSSLPTTIAGGGRK